MIGLLDAGAGTALMVVAELESSPPEMMYASRAAAEACGEADTLQLLSGVSLLGTVTVVPG